MTLYYKMNKTHTTMYEEERKRTIIIINGKQKCKSEWCHTFVNNKYIYCSYCYIYLFPE
jgi:hypothetical protein